VEFDELAQRVIGCAIGVHWIPDPALPELNDFFSKILRELRALRGKDLLILQLTRHYRAPDL
jgi:hypothetical protein